MSLDSFVVQCRKQGIRHDNTVWYNVVQYYIYYIVEEKMIVFGVAVG